MLTKSATNLPGNGGHMSQLFDYFACSRPLIERWADALEQQDEDLQGQIEAEMPRSLPLKNLGDDDVNILAWCARGEDGDVVEAVGEIDLVKAVSEEGPWVSTFRQPAVAALAKMRVGPALVRRWVQAVAQFHGETEDYYRELLTADTARALKDLCRLAVKERLGVFVCFHG